MTGTAAAGFSSSASSGSPWPRCCALPPRATGLLIAARALQGVGGALLTPGSLAIIQASFRPEDRARAIGAWSGLGGVAAASAPLLGGWLVGAGSWRLIFLINAPVAAFGARRGPSRPRNRATLTRPSTWTCWVSASARWGWAD